MCVCVGERRSIRHLDEMIDSLGVDTVCCLSVPWFIVFIQSCFGSFMSTHLVVDILHFDQRLSYISSDCVFYKLISRHA